VDKSARLPVARLDELGQICGKNRAPFVTFPEALTQSWTEWDIQRTDSKTTKLDETGFEIEVEYVLTQLVGAIARALIAVVVIATPSLLIPGTTPEGTQVVTLVALALGVFVGMEYAATYPGLVEFRDAPPFNRVRILTLF
jgi:hypothetical protein